MSGPIQQRLRLSPDPRSEHYYVSRKTGRENTQAHTHTWTQSQRLMLLSGRGMRPARSVVLPGSVCLRLGTRLPGASVIKAKIIATTTRLTTNHGDGGPDLGSGAIKAVPAGGDCGLKCFYTSFTLQNGESALFYLKVLHSILLS